ncbi:MAG: 16S rRNA (cytidine(1402)-2'-O)-methyltransferase [Brevinemataceae bacterium]
MSGKLFIVGTPIGNLEDITLRAVRTLKEVSVIACENILRTRALLSHLEIHHKRIIEYSPANERNSAKGILNFLNQGLDVALVSDAGTPGISDPGMLAVQQAALNGIPIIPIPGVSALTTILSVAGIGSENIVFTGFLSKKEGQILKILRNAAKDDNLIVIFVSCHRIKKFLKMLKDLEISADIVVGKELTKTYEHIFRGNIDEIEAQIQESEKGEFVIAVKFHSDLPEKQLTITASKKEKRKRKILEQNSNLTKI